jgi:acid phosphatase (class A)
MNVSFGLQRRKSSPVLRAPALLLFLFLAAAASLCAQSRYLAPGQPDGIALLPPPPVSGSAEEAADLAEAREVFNARTKAAEAQARRDESLAFSLFTPAIGPVFQPGHLPKTDALLKEVKHEISETINNPKNHWKRLRPYQLDEHLALGKPEDSFSYPSGHSTRGTVYAGVLAELFPERQEAVLALGRQIGWDRVIIGKHFPTDIYAGRVLGKAIVRELLASPAFQHDLAEARTELRAAETHLAQPAQPAAVSSGSGHGS